MTHQPKQRFALNPAALQERLDDSAPYEGVAAGDWKKFVVGDNYLRVLPPWSDAGTPFMEVHQWWLPAPISTFVNHYPRMSMAASCPVEAAIEDAKRVLGKEHPFFAGDGKRERGANVQRQYMANVLGYQVVQGPDGQPQLTLEREKPYVARLSPTVAHAILTIATDPMQQPSILDPEQGRILRINKPSTFEGKNNYTVTPVGVGHPFGFAVEAMNRIWDQLHDLTAIVACSPKQAQRVQAMADKIHKMLPGTSVANPGFPMGAMPAQYPPPSMGMGQQYTQQPQFTQPPAQQQYVQQPLAPPPMMQQPAMTAPMMQQPAPQAPVQQPSMPMGVPFNMQPPGPMMQSAGPPVGGVGMGGGSAPQMAMPGMTMPMGTPPQAPPQQTAPAPVAGSPGMFGGAGATMVKECFGHHAIQAPRCPKGGDNPHQDVKTCGICMWEHPCIQESNTRQKVPF